MDEDTVIEMMNVSKCYFKGMENELEVLHNINMKVKKGEFLSIVGESGSGKSTLMNIMGALDRPTSGEYYFKNKNIGIMDDNTLSEIRNQEIGFVFQNSSLISKLTALENVEVPMMYMGISKKHRRKRAESLLELMGLKDRMHHYPNELSGGQSQRVAIARALVNEPEVIFADEPTGALDSETGRLIMDIFHKLHKEEKKTIVFITHSNELAKETERMIVIADGNIMCDSADGGKAL